MWEVGLQPHIENKQMWDQFQWCAPVCGFTAGGCLKDSICVFQIAELCLFALTKGICCFTGRVVDNSGWIRESSWNEEEVRIEPGRKKIV